MSLLLIICNEELAWILMCLSRLLITILFYATKNENENENENENLSDIMSYIKQPTEFSCGPTALYNLLIHYNQHMNHQLTFRKIHQMCECESPIGTLSSSFNNCITKICNITPIKLKEFILQPNIHQITNHLNNNGVVLLEYYWEEAWDDELHSDEHYILLTSDSSNYYIINDDDVITNPRLTVKRSITEREIRKLIKPFEYPINNNKYQNHYDRIYPKAWLIEL